VEFEMQADIVKEVEALSQRQGEDIVELEGDQGNIVDICKQMSRSFATKVK